MREILLECISNRSNLNGDRIFIEGNIYTTDCKNWQKGFTTRNELGRCYYVYEDLAHCFKEVKQTPS